MQEVEKNIPLGERAYYVIKAMIIRAELAPGQLVPESVLAKQLGISRSPVKAALTRLQEDGLLTGEAWKVPTVVPLDLKYVDNVYQVRKALETQCALQAIDTIPTSKVEEFAGMLDRAEIELRDGDVTRSGTRMSSSKRLYENTVTMPCFVSCSASFRIISPGCDTRAARTTIRSFSRESIG